MVYTELPELPVARSFASTAHHPEQRAEVASAPFARIKQRLECEDRHVNPACAPAYLQNDFTKNTPTRDLFANTALWRALSTDRRVRAMMDSLRPVSTASHLEPTSKTHPGTRAPAGPGIRPHANQPLH